METLNLFLLPVVVAEAVRRCMKLRLTDVWDHLFYYGWNILLCLLSGHVITTVIRSLILQDIAFNSVSYSLLMVVLYSMICFLANLIFKNVSVKVDYEK